MKRILLFICVIVGLSTQAQIAFTSATAGNWHDPATWGKTAGDPNGGIPTAADNVTIEGGFTVTVAAGTTAVCNNLTLNSGANSTITNATNFNIEEGANVTVNGDFKNARFRNSVNFVYSSTSTLNRDVGTLIVQGVAQRTTATTNWRYRLTKRLPTNDQWYLISLGSNDTERAQGFIQTPSADHLANLVVSGDGLRYSLASYNGANAAGSKYEYVLTAASTTGSFPKIGYSIRVNNTEDSGRPDFRFSPYLRDANVSEDISDAGDGFNLVGNPYTAYLHANTAADGTNNLLAVNSAVLEEQTIWMWNNAKSGGAGFETFNLGDAALRISPIQGFFVKAKSGGGTNQSFSYTKDMRTHTKAGEFLKTTSNRLEIKLSIASKEKQNDTKVRYIDGTSVAFDNGYDSSTFGGDGAPSLAIYTELVGEDSSKKLAIQSLPTNYEELVVPVGVKVASEEEYTFSVDVNNLPEGIKVYLEDRTNNTFTRLDEANANYKVLLSGETKGRFFLHTKSSVLSSDSEILNSVKIYKNGASSLRITGLSTGKASVKVYNVLGAQVFSKSFTASNVNDIVLPNVNTGVYIVQLDTEKGSLKKKIVLE